MIYKLLIKVATSCGKGAKKDESLILGEVIKGQLLVYGVQDNK